MYRVLSAQLVGLYVHEIEDQVTPNSIVVPSRTTGVDVEAYK